MTTTGGTNAPRYRADIDGLRGLAVSAVVLFHAFPEWLASGFVGVDVFFVISGYLISGIVLSDLSAGRFTYRSFYVRRIRRIFPALAVVLVACLVAGWLILFPDEFSSLGQQIAGGAGFVANIVLWRQTGYFDDAANLKPLLHLWSLGVEEQFYFLWPLLLAATWKSRYRWPALALLFGLSFLLNIGFIHRSPDATFYLPVTRFWELLMGAVVAFGRFGLTEDPPPRGNPASRANLISWTGLLLLVSALVTMDPRAPFPGWWALLPTLGTAFLIGAGPSAWPNRFVLANSWLVAIGLVSYPLYLWHWPVLVFQRIVHPQVLAAGPRVAAVLVSAAFAALTYRFIERPVRFGRRYDAVVPALCLCVATVGVAGYVAGSGGMRPRSSRGEFQKIWDASVDWVPFGEHFRSVRYKNITLRAIGEDTKPHVLFLGDSNVEQFGPRIGVLIGQAPETHKSVFVAAIGGCPPIPGVLEKNHPGCSEFLADALEFARSSAVDSVVIGGCWNCYLRQDRSTGSRFSYYIEADGRSLPLNSGSESDRAALAALQSMLRPLTALKPTYLLLNVPSDPSVDPKKMVRRDPCGRGFELRVPTFTRQSFLEQYGSVRTMLAAAAASTGAAVIDPLDHLCAGAVCPSMTEDGRPLYKDDVHLRPFFIREHASFIDAVMRLP